MRNRRTGIAQLLLSKRATALPVSFLILFVSLTLIVSATYYISVAKIQARGQILNVAVSKQNMALLESIIGLTKWSPGTSMVSRFEDSGGRFITDPSAQPLLVNITDGTFSAILYNSSVGEASYELPAADIAVSTLFIKGDRRALINQSGLTTAKFYLSPDSPSPRLILTYRPRVTTCEAGWMQGKPVNIFRLYITNLNWSTSFSAQGKFTIKATCVDVLSSVQTHNLSYPITSILAEAVFDGRTDRVVLPISSNVNGTVIKVETLVCVIRLERVQGGI
jgi:hypothetical protein